MEAVNELAWKGASRAAGREKKKEKGSFTTSAEQKCNHYEVIYSGFLADKDKEKKKKAVVLSRAYHALEGRKVKEEA